MDRYATLSFQRRRLLRFVFGNRFDIIFNKTVHSMNIPAYDNCMMIGCSCCWDDDGVVRCVTGFVVVDFVLTSILAVDFVLVVGVPWRCSLGCPNAIG